MAADAVVRARIDGQIKEEAAVVLAAMGLTVSDAFRIMLTRVAKEKALPFEPLIPNAETIAAMKEARRGKLAAFSSVDDLQARKVCEEFDGRLECGRLSVLANSSAISSERLKDVTAKYSKRSS